MYRITKKEKRLVWYVSAVLGVTISLSAIIVVGALRANLSIGWDNLVVLGFIVALFPPATVDLLDSTWRSAIDRNIPKFLREVAEAGRSGLTLTRAIEISAQRKYGPLTKELQKVVAQLSWGVSLEHAMESFAERVDTLLGKRTAHLIIEVSRSGGDVQEVLESINKHIGDLQSIERERKSSLRPYVAIVYIAVGIFLFTDILLINTFFKEIARLQDIQQTVSTGALLQTSMDVPQLSRVLFHTSVVQAFFGGLVAGKMGEGASGAGMKHALILMLVSFLSFFFFVWR